MVVRFHSVVDGGSPVDAGYPAALLHEGLGDMVYAKATSHKQRGRMQDPIGIRELIALPSNHVEETPCDPDYVPRVQHTIH